MSTFDLDLPTGAGIPIEERKPEEITEGFGARTVPVGVAVWNPAFDVTPSRYVTGIITERGVIVLAIVRNDTPHRFDHPDITVLERGDRCLGDQRPVGTNRSCGSPSEGEGGNCAQCHPRHKTAHHVIKTTELSPQNRRSPVALSVCERQRPSLRRSS